MSGCGWNDYYATNDTPWTQPDGDLVQEVAGLTPGRALDLGAGEGADSLWLASLGWDVLAVDYAPTALATIERLAGQRGVAIGTQVADVTRLSLEPEFDLVCVCYLHMAAQWRAALLHAGQAALAPGGTLLYLGIARGPRGSDIPEELLAVPDEIVALLPDLSVERASTRVREIGCPEGNFEAEVILVRARRPA